MRVMHQSCPGRALNVRRSSRMPFKSPALEELMIEGQFCHQS